MVIILCVDRVKAKLVQVLSLGMKAKNVLSAIEQITPKQTDIDETILSCCIQPEDLHEGR